MEVIENEKAKILPNPDIKREQCVEQCNGCNKMFSASDIGDVCIAYVSPREKHRIGCPLQSNKVSEVVEIKRINPLKASKRSTRRKK